ncbi:MAG TPA: MFS transporter [Pantanalinema sp.]
MPAPFSRDFRLLWFGQAASQFGDRVHQLAMVWWVLDTTGSAAMTGALMVATSLPMIVVGPFAGALADRMDRRRLMLACDWARAILVTGMAALAYFHLLPLPLLFFLAVLLSCIGAAFTPAGLAIVPEVVEQDALLKANSALELTTQMAAILGPALGGLLVAATGAPSAFLLNAATFTVSGVALMAMSRRSHVVPPQGESYWETLKGGARTLSERPAIASLLGAFAVANLFLAPIPVLLPVFARDVFRAGASGLGMLEGALGVGMIAAALVLVKRGDVGRKIALIAGSFVLQGACLALMGLMPQFVGFLGGLFILGAALSALNIVTLAAFQRAVPVEQMGRFMGLLTAVVLGVMPASYALVGVLAARVPPSAIFTASGVMLALVGALLPLLPGVRGFETMSEAPAA